MAVELTGNGYSVTILGRAGIRYSEGADTVFVDGEMLTGEFNFVIYTSSICEWEADHRPITDVERARIINNIAEACAKNGVRLDID